MVKIKVIIVDVILGLLGVLIWFSDSVSHALGIAGFFKRLFAGLVCFIILFIVTYISTN